MVIQGRSWAYWLILIAAVGLAAWGMLPPEPRDTAGKADYSLTRALADLKEITRAPHPVGSAENARVREFLVARLRAMGLEVQVQRGTAVRQSPRAPQSVAIAPVANIIAVLPGLDRTQPAVAAMAHYDSVPFSFGASDDGAGTVAVLETAHALMAGSRPPRDVIFLLTDGEEAGLLGAQLFFDEHPLVKRIGIVVNAEARGSKGLAAMFQTSPGNAALIDLWATNTIRPSGNSISDAAYRLLPNDTDLSVSLLKGIGGINAAFGGGHFDYHSTTDSFATIDHGSLQHLGDFTLTTTRALAMAPALPKAARDAVFFDVFGLAVVRYPPWLGWLPLGIAGVGLVLLYRRETGVSLRRKLGGFVGIVAATAALAVASHAIGVWQQGSGVARLREAMAEIDIQIWVMAALVLATLFLLRPGRAMRLGALALLLLLGVAAQLFLPGAAFIFAWPVLLGIGLMLADSLPMAKAPFWRALAVLLTIVVLGLVLNILAFAYIMVGLLSAAVMVLALPYLAALLPDPPVRSRQIGALLLAAVVVAIGWTAAADGFSKRHPKPGDLFVLHSESDGKVRWATTSDARYLPAGKVEEFAFAPFNRRPILAVPAIGIAPQTVAERLTIAARSEGDSRSWDIAVLRPPRVLTIAVRTDRALTDVRLNGRAIDLEPKEWTRISYRVPQPFQLRLQARGPADAKVDIRYQIAVPGLPRSAPSGSDPLTNWTLLSGTELVVGEWRPGVTVAVPGSATGSRSPNKAM